METIVLIAFIFLLLFIYGLFSQRLNSLSISGPMVFTVLGLLSSKLEGIQALNIDNESLTLIGQIALIAILFTDASNISLKDFFKVYKTPIRLLFIGLPLTMIVGTLTAKLFFPGYDWLLLAVLAFILSPTDAALGQAVVQSEMVPKKIRESINVESGLNDGLVLPPILICLAMLQEPATDLNSANLLPYIAKQLLLAPLVGSITGWGGSKLINWSVRKRLSDHLFQGISIVALAIVSYVLAEHLGGNGYISAFVSGLFFNADSKKVFETGQEFGEYLSQPLVLFVFFVLGAIMLPHYWDYFTLEVVIYALLSLTVLRMIPVIICLNRDKITFKEKVFIAWFGPRGIASILYFLLAFNMLPTDPGNETIFATIILTVTLSIFMHGITAVPYSNWLGKQTKAK
ncbi:cation:proton antiporter [Aureitalea marina]|uniref:Cation/H+ exchanger transmembrane domain-containing protein n=1 Tax=Aureitalea marina TaxID=930804 RepID=A0A2S7KSU3_9FLAO|nr:sodium:proton antiporter [Aureitalea marina]PQB05695.1 hypothetical protein BST85_12895 [Aureitalea marina]